VRRSRGSPPRASSARFPLERAGQALAALERREAPGKIVVEIDGA
jgi:hypothetical protein